LVGRVDSVKCPTKGRRSLLFEKGSDQHIFFETGPHCIAQAGLELAIQLDYQVGGIRPCSTLFIFF
jgi:hypothetical protein